MLKNMFTQHLAIDDGLSISGAGAEEPEVAEPAEGEEGAEELEVAEPVVEEGEPSNKTAEDSAWAAMRRRAEEAEARQAEIEAQNAMMAEALGMYFEGDPVEMAIQARANATGVSPEVERARMEAEIEKKNTEVENANLRNELQQIKIERMMEQGLADIQQIDANVNDITDLGEDFPKYIAAGLSSIDAYFAVKAKEAKTKVNPPKPIGSVNSTKAESDYFTKEQVEAMSDEELEENFEAIERSLKKW